MSSPSRSGASTPCGCGGASHASASSSSGCGCGGSCGGSCGTGDCHSGGAVRPRFFAGQLLTEEDLQALSEYVAVKSRLHNRHFFGEGVVCGFEVSCHPCGGGKVIVHPGHALDCCGNDIVLGCKETLDVNALVRDLRQRLLGGHDCGDPCAEPVVASNRRCYCLYARYCEALTDPVSAYATDEPCGAAGCEPTRVREGLRFELRCREHAKPPAGAIGRIASCLGNAEELQKLISDLTALDRIVRQSEEALALEHDAKPFNPDAMLQSTNDLSAALGKVETQPNGTNIRSALGKVAVMAVHLERFNKLSKRDPGQIGRALEAFNRVARVVVPKIEIAAPTLLEKSFARKNLERAGRAINAAAPGTQIILWHDESVPVLNGQMDEQLCALWEKLLDRLDAAPDLTRCALRGEVRSLPISCPPRETPREFPVRVDLARKLVAAWLRFLQDCVCRALLPPCPPCDDPAVLLACLEVESCEVVKVCNLERTLVPTAAALRHWLPLDQLGALVEQLCCRDFRWPELPDAEPGPTINLRTALPQIVAFAREGGLLNAGMLSVLRGLAPQPAEPSVAPAPAMAGDLESLRSDLADLARRNTALEKRLKSLEGRKKP